MSFTDQKPRKATAEVIKNWGGVNNNQPFRCYLCGHKFEVGDYWRWVLATKINLYNFTVCEKCDGPDVLEKWKAANEEAETRFWWLLDELNY